MLGDGIEEAIVLVDGSDARQMNERARLSRLVLQHALERRPRVSQRRAAAGRIVKEHLTELRPGGDVVGLHAEDRAIDALGLARVAVQEGIPRHEQATVALADAVGMAQGVIGLVDDDVRLVGPPAGDGGPVARECEGGIECHRATEGVVGGERLAGAEELLTLEVCLEGGER